MSENLETCPCCGGALAGQDLSWNYQSRTLINEKGAVVLSGSEAKLFDLLWRARSSGARLDRHALMHRLYGGDPDGGPASAANAVSVHLFRIRNAVASLGLAIRRYSGDVDAHYRIVRSDRA